MLGTASSESAMVPVMQKLEKLGCSRAVVGLVIPSGMSFNMDGTSIYITMSAIFVAQALNIDLTLDAADHAAAGRDADLEGRGGRSWAPGFVTLAATLAVVPTIPVAGLALILGVDRFMAEMRSITNFTGNAVATIVVSRWEGEIDMNHLRAELDGRQLAPDVAGRPAIAEEKVPVGVADVPAMTTTDRVRRRRSSRRCDSSAGLEVRARPSVSE